MSSFDSILLDCLEPVPLLREVLVGCRSGVFVWMLLLKWLLLVGGRSAWNWSNDWLPLMDAMDGLYWAFVRCCCHIGICWNVDGCTNWVGGVGNGKDELVDPDAGTFILGVLECKRMNTMLSQKSKCLNVYLFSNGFIAFSTSGLDGGFSILDLSTKSWVVISIGLSSAFALSVFDGANMSYCNGLLSEFPVFSCWSFLVCSAWTLLDSSVTNAIITLYCGNVKPFSIDKGHRKGKTLLAANSFGIPSISWFAATLYIPVDKNNGMKIYLPSYQEVYHDF